MKVLITGATGFVGKRLVFKLLLEGHEVYAVTRSKDKAEKLFPQTVKIVEWNYSNQDFPQDIMNEVDAVVNLMGENISSGRWTDQQKQKIRDSRIISTNKIVNAINNRSSELSSFISTSAIGIYHSNTGKTLTEESAHNDNAFLGKVCVDWEKEALACNKTKRTLITRFGVVLGKESGAIAKLYPIFRIGGGGPIGLGKAFMSWIHVDDCVHLISTALNDERYEGIVNAVSSSPTTNKDFTKAFADSIGLPALFPVPPLALKIVFGEMSQIILDSQKVIPEKLNSLGHKFLYPTIRSAFKQICQNFEVLGDEIKGAETFEAYQFIPKKKEEVFDFFTDPYNLEKITPDLLKFKIKTIDTDKIQEGSNIVYSLRVHGVPMRWKTLITSWKDNEQFVDIQLSGPYSLWHHTHSFFDVPGGTLIHDIVRYKLPMGIPGFVFGMPLVKKDVNEIFNFRTKVIDEIFNQ